MLLFETANIYLKSAYVWTCMIVLKPEFIMTSGLSGEWNDESFAYCFFLIV